MINDEIVQLLRAGFPLAEEVKVEGDGHKVVVTVVSQEFEPLRAVQKQQRVYACLGDMIASGAIHAVSMRTLTPEEWRKMRMFG